MSLSPLSSPGTTRSGSANYDRGRQEAQGLIPSTDDVSPAELVFFPFVTNRSWYEAHWYQDSERPGLPSCLAALLLRFMRVTLEASRSIRRKRTQLAAGDPSAVRSSELQIQ